MLAASKNNTKSTFCEFGKTCFIVVERFIDDAKFPPMKSPLSTGPI